MFPTRISSLAPQIMACDKHRVMSLVPKPWRWFSKLDVLIICLSHNGLFTNLLSASPQTRIASVDDALVQLDQATANGLRASLDAESLVQLDIAMTAFMQGKDTKIPVAEALLSAQELGGLVCAWSRAVVCARRKGLIRKIADAIWDSHARIVNDALARGIDDAEITRMQGWVPDHIKHLENEAGFRRPGETAVQNRARSRGRLYASWEVGWGVDARCRGNPISSAVTEYQRVGWRWADALFRDSSRQAPHEGMAVTYNMMRYIPREYRDPPSWR